MTHKYKHAMVIIRRGNGRLNIDACIGNGRLSNLKNENVLNMIFPQMIDLGKRNTVIDLTPRLMHA